jgi:molecular chaperone GrpE (heat shock protein)
MGNNFSKSVRHDVRKQGQKPRQHGNTQSSQKLSREQLIHRLETLREELEEHPNLNDQRKARIQEDMSNYSQQLDKLI